MSFIMRWSQTWCHPPPMALFHLLALLVYKQITKCVLKHTWKPNSFCHNVTVTCVWLVYARGWFASFFSPGKKLQLSCYLEMCRGLWVNNCSRWLPWILVEVQRWARAENNGPLKINLNHNILHTIQTFRGDILFPSVHSATWLRNAKSRHIWDPLSPHRMQPGTALCFLCCNLKQLQHPDGDGSLGYTTRLPCCVAYHEGGGRLGQSNSGFYYHSN